MKDVVGVKIIAIPGINPKAIENMINEFKNPSDEQKIAEELYALREKNQTLEKQVSILKDERARLKRTVESAIATIISTAYFKVDDAGKVKLDQFRSQASENLRTSDIVGMFIGE